MVKKGGMIREELRDRKEFNQNIIYEKFLK